MSYPTTFANLAAGNQPASLFDTMFTIAGEQGNIPCTAAGTNAVTLTPNSSFFSPTSYVNKQMTTWRAVNTSTGSVTIQISALGLVKLFTVNGVQAASGDIVSGTEYTCTYSSALDSGNGGFQIVNGTVTATSNPVIGQYNNKLLANNTGTPNTQIDVVVGELIVENSTGGTVRTTGLSSTVTCNLGVTGANGLDAGTIAASKIYFVYGIFSPTSGTATLASLSPTAPTAPAGFSYKSILGAWPTDGSANLLRGKQRDDHWWQVMTTGGSFVTIMAVATGTYSTTVPTWATPSVAGILPFNGSTPLVSEINIAAISAYKNNAGGGVQVAPNNTYGGALNTTGSAPYFDNVGAGNTSYYVTGWMPVETTGVAVATSNNAAVLLLGWRMARF